jgi:hypothetical protein
MASSSLLVTGGSALLAALVTLVAYLCFFASTTQVEAFFSWWVVRVLCAGVDVRARRKAKRYFRVRRRTWIKPAATADGVGAAGGAGGKDGRKEEGLGIEAGGKGKVRACVTGGGVGGGDDDEGQRRRRRD